MFHISHMSHSVRKQVGIVYQRWVPGFGAEGRHLA